MRAGNDAVAPLWLRSRPLRLSPRSVSPELEALFAAADHAPHLPSAMLSWLVGLCVPGRVFDPLTHKQVAIIDDVTGPALTMINCDKAVVAGIHDGVDYQLVIEMKPPWFRATLAFASGKPHALFD